jgi:hypothetical protein
VNNGLRIHHALVLLHDLLLDLHVLLLVRKGHLRLLFQKIDKFIIHHHQGWSFARRIQLFEEVHYPFLHFSGPFFAKNIFEGRVLLRFLNTKQRIVRQKLLIFGQWGASTLKICTKILLGLAIRQFFLAKERMDVIDEEIQLNVEFHLHRLRVLSSHRKRHELRKFGHELVTAPLIKQLG